MHGDLPLPRLPSWRKRRPTGRGDEDRGGLRRRVRARMGAHFAR
ncbi:hypothetical protein Rumeso_03790 [Rubellimicrobium mesophilum DSM 19309]|uniref:Uncharacterized protein n=1 Tax=Rubellimicrobium mesophilum DSM 19309 TaxID=442562 RepID=A0A017HL38_9RHOB|nr:hypothetical protein Rumeso_03790 [Rubellimicrobium mesophilum DSM 19309]